MISTPAQVAEFQKSQLDALFALSHTMFEATEKLVDLNLAATKALSEAGIRLAPAPIAQPCAGAAGSSKIGEIDLVNTALALQTEKARLLERADLVDRLRAVCVADR